MGLRYDTGGQGSAEYVLLFAAVIVIVIAGLYMYYSYFSFGEEVEMVDVSLTITNTGPRPSQFIYEANNTTGVNRHISTGNPGNFFFTLPAGNSRTFSLGTMHSPASFTIEGGVGNPTSGSAQQRGEGQSGRWTLTIGNQTISWDIKGPYDWRKKPSGSVIRSFSISGGGGGLPFNITEDLQTVRTNVSGAFKII